jgi:hypothetical protein
MRTWLRGIVWVGAGLLLAASCEDAESSSSGGGGSESSGSPSTASYDPCAYGPYQQCGCCGGEVLVACGDSCPDCSGGCQPPPACESAANPLYAASSDCAWCSADLCCDLVDPCTYGSPCDNLVGCIIACADDATCAKSCKDKYPDGVASFEALIGCLHVQCPYECSLGGYYVCDSTAKTSIPECSLCVGAACCDTVKTCFGAKLCSDCSHSGDPGKPGTPCGSDPTYTALLACVAGCGADCGG